MPDTAAAYCACSDALFGSASFLRFSALSVSSRYWIADVSKLAGSAYLVTVIVLFLTYMCFCLYFTLLRVKVFRSLVTSIAHRLSAAAHARATACTRSFPATPTAHPCSSSATLSRASYPPYGIPPSPLIWHPAATILRQSILTPCRQLQLPRHAARGVHRHRNQVVQAGVRERVWGTEQLCWHLLRPIPSHCHRSCLSSCRLQLFQARLVIVDVFCFTCISWLHRSKMSAYFRGSNPHQADFMQQGISP